jgi:hypothetical protein
MAVALPRRGTALVADCQPLFEGLARTWEEHRDSTRWRRPLTKTRASAMAFARDSAPAVPVPARSAGM